MVTVDTVKKSWGNTVLAKHVANYWHMREVVNLPLLSSVYFKGSTNFY